MKFHQHMPEETINVTAEHIEAEHAQHVEMVAARRQFFRQPPVTTMMPEPLSVIGRIDHPPGVFPAENCLNA